MSRALKGLIFVLALLVLITLVGIIIGYYSFENWLNGDYRRAVEEIPDSRQLAAEHDLPFAITELNWPERDERPNAGILLARAAIAADRGHLRLPPTFPDAQDFIEDPSVLDEVIASPWVVNSLTVLKEITPQHVLHIPVDFTEDSSLRQLRFAGSEAIYAAFHLLGAAAIHAHAQGNQDRSFEYLRALLLWSRQANTRPTLGGIGLYVMSESIFLDILSVKFQELGPDPRLLQFVREYEPIISRTENYRENMRGWFLIMYETWELHHGLEINEFAFDTYGEDWIPLLDREVMAESYLARAVEGFIALLELENARHSDEIPFEVAVQNMTDIFKKVADNEFSYDFFGYALRGNSPDRFYFVIDTDHQRCITSQTIRLMSHLEGPSSNWQLPEEFYEVCQHWLTQTTPLVHLTEEGILVQATLADRFYPISRDTPREDILELRLDGTANPRASAYWEWLKPRN